MAFYLLHNYMDFITISETQYNLDIERVCITMSSKGKRYTNDFKKQIIDLHLAGIPVSKLAEEYGLVEQTIYKWKKLYVPSIETEEGKEVSLKKYKELENKVRQLELENEILKKATAIFAKKH